MEYTDYINEDNNMNVVSVGKLDKNQNLNSYPGPSLLYALTGHLLKTVILIIKKKTKQTKPHPCREQKYQIE